MVYLMTASQLLCSYDTRIECEWEIERDAG